MIRINYEPNNAEFGKLMRSGQTQDVADQGARAGAREAQAAAGRAGLPADYVDSIKAEEGPMIALGRNWRRTARVVARHRLAGVFEFGSGQRDPRPQGGNSPRYRILGSTAAKIGSPPDGTKPE